MGQSNSHQFSVGFKKDEIDDGSINPLRDALTSAQGELGTLAVAGRYHRLPRRIEDDYTMSKEVLGTGLNGSVVLMHDPQTGVKYAVKAFKTHCIDAETIVDVSTELELFLEMDHPNVANLVDVYESEEHIHLVMEYMTGGTLFNRILSKGQFSEADAAEAAYQMLLALNYLHSKSIIHRDIKLNNFLFDNETSDHLKLVDFGLSKVFDKHSKLEVSCGTLAYTAPEVLDKSYDEQCDMWSIGVTVFILLFGYMPFDPQQSEDQQREAIRHGKYEVRPDRWDNVSIRGQDFVKSCLKVDSHRRLSTKKALEHVWIVERENLHKQESHMNAEIASALVSFGQASHFRRACMSMMAWSLTNEQTESVREAFLELDETHTGTVTLLQFRKVLDDKFHIDDEVVRTAFKALDHNHEGLIHYSDYLAAMVSSRIAVHDDLMHAAFRRFDVEGTGYISRDNLLAILDDSITEAEVDDIMSKIGYSDVPNSEGKISYKDFVKYLRSEEGADSGHSQSAIKFVDTEVRANKVGFNDENKVPHRHKGRSVMRAKTKEHGKPSRTNDRFFDCCFRRECHEPAKPGF